MRKLPFKFNIRLIHMGIFLVSVPLLFELGFIVALYTLYAGAEADAARTAHSKAISDSINGFIKDLAGLYHKVDGENLFHPGVDTAELRRGFVRLHEEVDNIGKLVSDDPRSAQTIQGAEDALRDIEPSFEQVLNTYDHGSPLQVQQAMRLYRRPIQRRLGVLVTSDLLVLAREHKSIEDRSPAVQAEFRRRMKIVLVMAVLFNVVITIALAIWFSRAIARRVAVLADNSMRLAEGKPLHQAVGGTDEIAHLDRVFHAMADALAEAERSKQEMIGMVTHDLKTPLTTVSALLEMLEDGIFGALNDQGIANLKVVSRNVTRMNGLIRDLLDIEKIKSGMLELHREDLDVKDLLEECAESVRAIANDRGIKISVACPTVEIFADNQRLQQVLINLLSNAIKFSPDNSEVALAAAIDGGCVHCTVKDQGRGIPASMHSAIFDRFRQTQASDATVKGGTGLGLAICKALVELHGGQIGVISEPGQGSTFFFNIPILQSESGENELATDAPAKKALA